MKKLSFFILLSLGLLSSCKKDSEPAPPTRTELLTGKKWQVSGSQLESPGFPTVDTYALSQPCSQDDFEQYKLPNNYIHDEGPTTCTTNGSQTELGVWALLNDDSQLVITLNGASDTYTIEELTASTLKISLSIPQSTGVNATLRIAYKSI